LSEYEGGGRGEDGDRGGGGRHRGEGRAGRTSGLREVRYSLRVLGGRGGEIADLGRGRG
jgi:hypothetical protein